MSQAPKFGREKSRTLPSHERGKPGGGLSGLWEGKVEDCLDPERVGRVKVRVFDLHDESVPIEELPWAEPNFPSAFTHPDDEDRNGGFFHVPPNQSLVNIMFRHGDPDRPVWMGGWFPQQPAIRGRDYYISKDRRLALYNADGVPSCATWATARGFRIELDDDNAEIRITSPQGHKITMSDIEGDRNPQRDAEGNITQPPNEIGDGIKLEDHRGNYIHMHTGDAKLLIRWDGDVIEHITGDVDRIIEGSLREQVNGKASMDYRDEVHWKGAKPWNLDAPQVWINSQRAIPETPQQNNQGEEERGDTVGSALADLGVTIRRLFVGNGEDSR